MAKTHYVESSYAERTDPETGEITRFEGKKVVKINLGKQDEFFMTFCNYLSSVYGLKYADDIKMIIKLNEWALFDTGSVQLTPKRRLLITDELRIKNDAISKSLRRLKEANLIAGDKNDYIIQPIIFWKGDRSTRMEFLKKEGLDMVFKFKIEK